MEVDSTHGRTPAAGPSAREKMGMTSAAATASRTRADAARPGRVCHIAVLPYHGPPPPLRRRRRGICNGAAGGGGQRGHAQGLLRTQVSLASRESAQEGVCVSVLGRM